MQTYLHLGKPEKFQLTREQLKIYLCCNGNTLDDIANMTKISHDVLFMNIEQLIAMRLIAPKIGERTADAAPLIKEKSQSQHELSELTEALFFLQNALQKHLGAKASSLYQRLQECQTMDDIRETVPTMIKKVKITMSEKAAAELEKEYQELFRK